MCNQMVVTCLAEKRSQHAYQNPVGSILYHSLLKVCVWVTVSWHTVQRSLGGDYVTIHTHIKIIPRYLKYYLMVLADLLQLKLARKQKNKIRNFETSFSFFKLSFISCLPQKQLHMTCSLSVRRSLPHPAGETQKFFSASLLALALKQLDPLRYKLSYIL